MHPDSYNSSISSGPSLHKAGQSIRADFFADLPAGRQVFRQNIYL